MAKATSQLIPIDDDNGEPPDPPNCLSDIRLVQLVADPPTTEPFGAPVTIRWNVDVPGSCPVSLNLNNQTVARSGSMIVHPAATTTFRLEARSLGFQRNLGSITVPVATQACVTGSLTEEQVQTELRAAIAAVDAQSSRLKQRRPATVSIDPNGIKVAVRLSISINNFPDPDVDVDFTLGLQIRDGAVEPFFRSFSVDVDWPWWVTTVSLGITKIVEEVIENEIEGRLKQAILDQVKQVIAGVVDDLPASLRLFRIVTLQDRIDVTVCPVGDHQPHVVLGTFEASTAVLGTILQAEVAKP